MSRKPWTEERVADLKHLWEQGFSGTLIAGLLGDTTRNAVIGKAYRMGLPSRRTRKAVTPRVRTPKEPKAPKPPRTYRVPPMYLGDNGIRHHPREITETCPTEGSLGILDLAARTCRYPFGEPAVATYCGARTQHGSAFCPGHHALTHKRADDDETTAIRAQLSRRRSLLLEAAE